jgi:hypothetical protein
MHSECKGKYVKLEEHFLYHEPKRAVINESV